MPCLRSFAPLAATSTQQYAAVTVSDLPPNGLAHLTETQGAKPDPVGSRAAIAMTGQGVFSFGTGTDWGSNFTDYMTSQSFTYRGSGPRVTHIYVLPTSPTQERDIRAYLDSIRNKPMPDDKAWNHPLQSFNDNCASRISDASVAGGEKFLRGANTPGKLILFLEEQVKAGKAIRIDVPKTPSSMPLMLQRFDPTRP